MNHTKYFCYSTFFFALMLCATATSYGSHIRAGEITVERVSCTSLTFRITLTIYTNTIGTDVIVGGSEDYLDFGDGSDDNKDGIPGILVPLTPNIPRPDLGEGVAMAVFSIVHE